MRTAGGRKSSRTCCTDERGPPVLTCVRPDGRTAPMRASPVRRPSEIARRGLDEVGPGTAVAGPPLAQETDGTSRFLRHAPGRRSWGRPSTLARGRRTALPWHDGVPKLTVVSTGEVPNAGRASRKSHGAVVPVCRGRPPVAGHPKERRRACFDIWRQLPWRLLRGRFSSRCSTRKTGQDSAGRTERASAVRQGYRANSDLRRT